MPSWALWASGPSVPSGQRSPSYLESRPEHFGGQTVGLFGLVAMGGAAVAPFSGWLSDRYSARFVNGSSLLTVIAAFLLMLLAGHSLWWLIVGVFLMDAGVQTNQISNQTRIYALAAGAAQPASHPFTCSPISWAGPSARPWGHKHGLSGNWEGSLFHRSGAGGTGAGAAVVAEANWWAGTVGA